MQSTDLLVTLVDIAQTPSELRKDAVLINGQPATPELWDAWMECIGAGPKARKATLAANRACHDLAVQLKKQAERKLLNET